MGVTKLLCDGGGWTLVASWGNASEWTKTSISTSQSFLTTPLNAFSSNFGDFKINYLRIQASNQIDSQRFADFYYKWNNSISWKEVWAPSYGNNKGYLSSTPRQALKQFSSAYNIQYQTEVAQTWANISDWCNQSTLCGDTANWWSGLTTPGVPLGIYSLSKYYSDGTGDVSDGSFGLSASNRSDNSGQDTYFNVKLGWDDGQQYIRLGGGNTTNNYEQQSSGVDAATGLWLWIR